LTPIPQDDGPTPVVPIHYTEEFELVMGYFRAILAIDERSERALKLTEHAIDLNAANYTAWQFRRACLDALGSDLIKELEYARSKGRDSPKNYQLWYHRRAIVERCQNYSKEKEVVKEFLGMDSKNYHVWSHRHWVLKTFECWDGELDFVDELLEEDIRNNSAWNHRYFVINSTDGWNSKICSREIEYAKDKIQKNQGNESAWNYMRGVLKHGDDTHWNDAENFCKNVDEDRFSMDLLIAILRRNASKESQKEAIQLCEQLAEKVDVIRYRYWLYIREQIRAEAA